MKFDSTQLVFDGNSLTHGVGATDGNDYPSRVAVELGYTSVLHNVAVSGQTTEHMQEHAAHRVDALFVPDKQHNVLVAWEITNDLFFGASVEAAYGRFVDYCQARRAKGWRVVILTVLPRKNEGTPPTHERDRQTINTRLREHWHEYSDALCDIADDSRLNRVTLSCYTSDLVHLNDAGYALVASHVAQTLKLLK